uniref:Enoyl reductase (ER) domain-containing protein n=1 Tax=Aplanochytrium stocchinoi TaxID=215587 RepID=A0A7S3LJ07_9STRA|mmetsp:Transcript_5185/g.6141  ORF Transcript_5185/g.6141 Transcript_5185/m.6141 type:complete len:362 (-) Transcript_5185:177-1262(-)|eukprot:CAMPEP_0204831922 /NCGR_PEP_ID=MMETSP1346-20131115/12117_1 /ASSEMBLY_ACC=CAM_ASM_000771 /TAXON_ID=215587 /ORGANISM="Aplanochytrium stocchinoi, Strain GSBS06" /LENGTH=361 /DNA_ID=CAMNT_0051963365 /DNA_START=279 /DNA_END=1364 /DNA_ORIENTATION=-
MCVHMRAVVRSWSGLKYSETHPMPRAPKKGSDEVLVRVHAAAINPVDYKAPRLILGPVAGLDVAGVIEKIPEDSTATLSVGDRVYGTARGSLANFVLANAGSLAKIPDGISFQQAAAFPTAYITALQGIRDKGKGNLEAKLKKNTENGKKVRVLVIGASGGCGIAAVQLLRALSTGAGVEIVGICSGKNAAFVKEQGADLVLDYTDPDFGNEEKDRYLNAPEEEKLDLVFDTATNSGKGEDYKNWSLKRMKKDGQYVSTNGSLGMWLRMFANQQKSNQHLFLTDMNTADLDFLSQLATKENSPVKPIISNSLPFTSAAVDEGFKLLKSRRTVGKIVFDVNYDNMNTSAQNENEAKPSSDKK